MTKSKFEELLSGRQASLPMQTRKSPSPKKFNQIVEIRESLDNERERRLWTEAIACARDVALAFLPHSKTKEKFIERSIVYGPGCTVTVRFSVPQNCEMPYGSDRFVLFGIQHLARVQNSPVVQFEKAGQLLEMFGIEGSGAQYRLLRERFERLKSLNVEIEATIPNRAKWGAGTRLLEEWALPTKKDVDAEKSGQGNLLQTTQDESLFFVRLADGLFNQIQRGNPAENLLLVRLDLLKLFRGSPIGWDFCVFLLHRCGSAKSTSVVPHEVLMELFKSGKEKDRDTIARLQGYHSEIMAATQGSLNSELCIVKEERKGRGRPRKMWGLKVGPSSNVVIDGKPKFPFSLE